MIQQLAETLKMNNLSFTEKTDYIVHVRVV